MRPITVTVTMPPNPGSPSAIAPGLTAVSAAPQQINLTATPTGGSNTNTWQGTASILNGLLTVVTTTSGAMSIGRLMGNGLPPNMVVTGPGPAAGQWYVSPATQGPVATQPMRLNTVVTLDAPRQITVTSTSDPLGGTIYTIYGTDAQGRPISEQMVSTGGPVSQTVQNFATVTQVTSSVGFGNPVNVGTAQSPATPPVMFDPYVDVAEITKTVTINGLPTWTVQITNDDPNSPTNPVPGNQMNWQVDPDAGFVAQTTPKVGTWAFVPIWARMILTSGSPAGSSATATFVQQGGWTI